MSEQPKRYSPEFKEQAARKVIDNSLPIAWVARELGINDATLGFWVKAYRKKIAGARCRPICRKRNAYRNSSGASETWKWSSAFSGKPRRTSRRSTGDR